MTGDVRGREIDCLWPEGSSFYSEGSESHWHVICCVCYQDYLAQSRLGRWGKGWTRETGWGTGPDDGLSRVVTVAEVRGVFQVELAGCAAGYASGKERRSWGRRPGVPGRGLPFMEVGRVRGHLCLHSVPPAGRP